MTRYPKFEKKKLLAIVLKNVKKFARSNKRSAPSARKPVLKQPPPSVSVVRRKRRRRRLKRTRKRRLPWLPWPVLVIAVAINVLE